MRKLLLAGVATFGASAAMVGMASAQNSPPPNPLTMDALQGKMAVPENAGAYTFGDNNYMSGTMAKGGVANPTPGTMVIRLGARVFANASLSYSNLNQVGTDKLYAQQFAVYMRMYPGMDAMAANGLRYGAAFELRTNFGTPTGTTGANGGTGYTSTQTVYVRRDFMYVAGDSWGIIRFGQMDGLIGTYDNGGQTTGVYLSPTGSIVGGDLQSMGVGNAYMTPFFGAQSGNEYGNTKVVYLSPSLAGFDFGFQYAPNPYNGYAIGAGGCASAAGGGGCPSLSSTATTNGGSFGSRTENQYAIGARYTGVLGGVGILAYGVYMGSGTLNYNGPTTAAVLGTAAVPGSTYNGRFDGLSLGSFGANITYAGFSVFGNTVFGAVNGVLAARPQHGVHGVGWVGGVKYVTGPFSIGALYGGYDSQGAQQMTGFSQRHENVFYAAATYAVSPGLTAYLDYVYGTRNQSGFNFATGAVSTSTAFNHVQSQGVMLGTSVKW
jgi:outer membrane protein OmpU